MKIAVVGHLCLDVIHRPGDAPTAGYGGIFFTLTTLANLLGPEDTVVPILGVGKGEYDKFIARLSSFPNISTDGIYRFSGPTNEVHLKYSGAGERVERSEHIADPVPYRKISPYLDADMILINMISGFDITLETLDEIRMEVRERHIPIYLDVHSLTLGIREDFTRFHRPVPLWRRWLFMLHGVQMNEEEAAIVSGEQLGEIPLANHVLALHTKVFNITRGAGGCTSFIDNHKHLQRVDTPGIRIEGEVDPTGCGDVFGAAYCAMYLKSHDIAAAALYGNRVAAAKAGMIGSGTIDDLTVFRITGRVPEHTA
jgi:sugar/nucleoside kinase (ribokinase family)